MSRHRAEVRPRYGRIAVLGASVLVTAVAVLGAVGLLPGDEGPPSDARPAADAIGRHAAPATPSAATPSAATPSAGAPSGSAAAAGAAGVQRDAAVAAAARKRDTTLPADSGEGRRAVFSESRQRVWIVGEDGTVERTYLVSGSLLDNLDPGTYEVYSRSRWAVGIEDSGVMQYFVRFTKGPSGAAIGFHSIPTKDGEPLQTVAQLGTPRSHGCIRQRTEDAVAMWDFADLGTTVVVTA